MSIALDIVNAFRTRAAEITVANGYATNIGLAATIAERQYNQDEITTSGAVNVFDSSDSNDDDELIGDDIIVRLPVTVEGNIDIGTGNVVQIAHALVADIKTAVLLANDRTMNGLVLDVRYIGREISYPKSDSAIVSVSVEFYVLYTEPYGAP